MHIRFARNPERPINNIDRKYYLSDAAVKGNVGASVLARAMEEWFMLDSPARSSKNLERC
jgi:hypothetical protein